ncbi:MAG TPA: CAP domain-containing protein [Pyrinomonadaceae bacterium]
MKYNNLFPLNVARRRACRVSLLSVSLLLAGVAASANNNGSKYVAPPTRPVARLVTATRTETSRPQPQQQQRRPRLVATAQVVPVAAVRTANVAAATFAVTSDEQRVVDLINAERRKRGAGSLTLDGKLMRIARLHSENMVRQGFFSHVGQDGLDASGRVEAAGVRDWRALAENIAYNHERFADPCAQVVERWMLSVKHRHNILNADYTHTGLGIARAADGRIFFTQVFMTR